jgi:hypothetical protein
VRALDSVGYFSIDPTIRLGTRLSRPPEFPCNAGPKPPGRSFFFQIKPTKLNPVPLIFHPIPLVLSGTDGKLNLHERESRLLVY